MGDSNNSRFVCLRFSYVSILAKEIILSRICVKVKLTKINSKVNILIERFQNRSKLKTERSF